MTSDEPQSQNVIKGGYFNVSTKPADPKVNVVNNWGTASDYNVTSSPNTTRQDQHDEPTERTAPNR